MLRDQLQTDLTAAIKGGNLVMVDALRVALGAVATAAAAADREGPMTDAEVQAVLLSETRKRHEASDAFKGAAVKATKERLGPLAPGGEVAAAVRTTLT